MDALFEFYRPLFGVFLTDEFQSAIRLIFYAFPIWGPVLLIYNLWFIWIKYIRLKFISNQKHVLLEIKIPREIYKSPRAMENVLSQIHITSGELTWVDRYIKGKVRTWFTFEIVSTEGILHFYVWGRAQYKELLEVAFYSQYPDIEIFEVPDYTTRFPYFDKEKFNLWGIFFKLDKEDPYPIKTYIDFGLDKDPKEEFRIDPMASMIEYLGSIGKGQHFWFQIVFRSHKKKMHGGHFFFEETDVVKEGQELIKKLRSEWLTQVSKGSDGITYERIPTKGEAEIFASIERNTAKLAFDCGMRILYITEKDRFYLPHVTSSLTLLRAFNSKDLNGFSVDKSVDYDYPWSDPWGWRSDRNRREYLKAYRLREYFHYPPERTQEPFILSTEELASVFHLPSGTVTTPSLERIPSKKSEAPSNLPR